MPKMITGLALAVGALLAATAAPSLAADGAPSCGETITQDITLTADLVDCPPPYGLVIGADAITLDLGGHVLDGTGIGVGVRSHGQVDVRIENGTVREFGTAVSLGRAPSFPGGSERGPAAQRNVLRRLAILDNGTGVRFFRVSDNALEESTVAGNRLAGVDMNDTSGGNRVHENLIARNLTGINLYGRGEEVSRNRVVDNELTGILVGLLPNPFFSAADVRVVDNVVEGNGGDGIWTRQGSGFLIEGNRARANGDDGIDVDCPDARCPAGHAWLSANDARRNGDLGIEADAGAGDGGGNRAKHNGNRAQCTGVACR